MGINVCVVGATGLVGGTILDVLASRDFPIENLKLLASSRSAGKKISFKGKEYTVEEINEEAFKGYDVALFAAGGEVARIYAPIAKESGCTVIDNSSYFREDSDKALIVPEINISDARKGEIISNPNCSTIQSVLPIKPIDDLFNVVGINYTTYQAVSGSGMKGKNDLINALKGEECTFYPYNISKTCIPEIDKAMPNLYTKEEIKMVNETRKILHKPDLRISATCVRVPILNSHAVSILLDLEKDFTLDEVRECLANYPGIKVVDDIENHLYPVATETNGQDLVYVGRIRRDTFLKNGLLIYTVADNIRKGAATNAVDIAVYMYKNGLL